LTTDEPCFVLHNKKLDIHKNVIHKEIIIRIKSLSHVIVYFTYISLPHLSIM